MDEIEQLIAAYATALPAKLDDVKVAAVAVMTSLASGTAPDWDTLVHRTHKLSGSSGTYGFMHLSAVLRHVEESVGVLRAPEAAIPAAAAREHLERCVSVLDVQGARAARRAVTQEEPPLVVAPLESHLAAIRGRKEAA